MRAFSITAPFETGYQEIPEPELTPGSVLLAVKFVGLCGSDLNTFRGKNPLITLPRIPGHEISAVIAAIGEGVPDCWHVGQKVTVSPYTNCGVCPSCLAERPNCCQFNQTLGVQRDGALTKHIVVPWTKLFDADAMKQEEIALIEPLTVGGHASDRSGANEDSVAAVIGCGIDNVKALPEFRTLVLITYTQVLEVEGLGVSHIGTHLTPLGIGATVAELNKVKSVTNENVMETLAVSLGLQRCNVLMACKLAGHAVVEHGQGSCSK